jgi:hypothetical protein
MDEHQGWQKKERFADHVEAPGHPPRPAARARARSPATSISGPNRLSGLLDQAISPQADVRHDDPADEGCVDVGQRAIVAGQAQLVRAGGCDASGEGHGDDD